MLFSAARADEPLYRETPGLCEFTGEMVARPLQIDHWMQQGFTEEQAREKHEEATAYVQNALGEHVFEYREVMDEYWFRVPEGRTENDLGRELLATGYFRYVCPNWWSAPSSSPDCTDDTQLGNQWHLERIEACAGWQIHSEGHDSVVLGLIDTGLTVSHEDVSTLNEFRRLGYNAHLDCWEGEPGCNISDWIGYPHGTWALGAAAATGDNGKGVTGIGWSIRHRMLDYETTTAAALNAMWVSAGVGDRVIVTTVIPDFSEENTWTQWNDNSESIRLSHEVVILHSAGNNPSAVYAPFLDMVSVGGTNQTDSVWWSASNYGSSTGEHIDVMAPAVSIRSTDGDCNTCYSAPPPGTSWAAPQAAGLCALIWSYNPDFTAADVEYFLYQGCDPIVGYDPNLHGHGRINVFNSLALASGAVWTRDPYPGTAGTANAFKAAGATAGSTIRFYYGTTTGQTAVPGCTNVVVGIDNAALLGTAVAGSNGASLLNQFVPTSWSQQTLLLQAVEEGSCRISNLVSYTFP